MTRNGVKARVIANFTPEEIQEIKDKRAAGVTIDLLCFQHGISQGTIYKILRS